MTAEADEPTVGSRASGSLPMPTTSVPPYFDAELVLPDAGPITPAANVAPATRMIPRRRPRLIIGSAPAGLELRTRGVSSPVAGLRWAADRHVLELVKSGIRSWAGQGSN